MGSIQFSDGMARRRQRVSPTSPPDPAQLLEALASDDSDTVRYSVADNTACPPRALGELMDDPDEEVQERARRQAQDSA